MWGRKERYSMGQFNRNNNDTIATDKWLHHKRLNLNEHNLHGFDWPFEAHSFHRTKLNQQLDCDLIRANCIRSLFSRNKCQFMPQREQWNEKKLFLRFLPIFSFVHYTYRCHWQHRHLTWQKTSKISPRWVRHLCVSGKRATNVNRDIFASSWFLCVFDLYSNANDRRVRCYWIALCV